MSIRLDELKTNDVFFISPHFYMVQDTWEDDPNFINCLRIDSKQKYALSGDVSVFSLTPLIGICEYCGVTAPCVSDMCYKCYEGMHEFYFHNRKSLEDIWYGSNEKCPDCNGTGLYKGLFIVESCRSCKKIEMC